VRVLEHADRSHGDENCERTVLKLYQGPFLPAETDYPWTVPMRERLRARFVCHLQEAGARLERASAWHDAAAIYKRGIDTDELAEEFYQGLMRCHLALGQVAEGLAVYRRLRQILSIVLSIVPAATSETLHRSLHMAGSAQRATS
jgi:two-component SAPR family response regulator